MFWKKKKGAAMMAIDLALAERERHWCAIYSARWMHTGAAVTVAKTLVKRLRKGELDAETARLIHLFQQRVDAYELLLEGEGDDEKESESETERDGDGANEADDR